MESIPEYRKSWLKLWSHIIVGNAYRPPANMRTQWPEKIKLPDKTMIIRKTVSTLTVTKPFLPTFGEYLHFVKK